MDRNEIIEHIGENGLQSLGVLGAVIKTEIVNLHEYQPSLKQTYECGLSTITRGWTCYDGENTLEVTLVKENGTVIYTWSY